MQLTHLLAENVRNLARVELEPHPRLTVLVGDNGQGKTNLLEAVHLAAALRPLRPLERASELMRLGAAAGVVRATFALDGPLDVEVQLLPRGRRATVGGKAVRDVAVLAARLGVVSFVPDDAAMIRGGPGERRRGLDRFAFSLLPGFAQTSRQFVETLDRRNRLLKEPVVDEGQLAAYTEPFVTAAVELTLARAEAAMRWAPVFAAESQALGGPALAGTLRYRSALVGAGAVGGAADAREGVAGADAAGDAASGAAGAGAGDGLELADDDGSGVDLAQGPLDRADLTARLQERLHSLRHAERRKRATLVGPQHDDLLVDKAALKARFLASQGEARALVLALKLAAVRILTEARGTGPLLLLDDVAGELDRQRAGRLVQAMADTSAQVFVTTTHVDTLPDLGDHRVVTLRGGALVPAAG